MSRHLPGASLSHLWRGSHIEDEATDAELITRYRAGDDTAAAALFTRHHGPAVRYASGLAGRSAGEDLAAESFTQVLAALRKGHGPDVAFRAYLITSVRNAYINSSKRDSRISWVDDHENLGTVFAAADEAGLRSESALLAQAFATLPERWQTVLWHTSVEDDSTAEVGRLLGITPSAVAALAYRAREGLRQAYLTAHLSVTDDPSCREVRDKLAAYSRGQLGTRETSMLEHHLDTCPGCPAVLADLRSITSDLPALLVPALLGSTGAAIQGQRPRTKNHSGSRTSGTRGTRVDVGSRAGLLRSGMPRTGAGRAVATVVAVAASSALVIAMTRGAGAPEAGGDGSARPLGGTESLELVTPPAPILPPPETAAPVVDRPIIELLPPAPKPPRESVTPPPPPPEPDPGGTTYDLVLGLANVNEMADDMSFDLDVTASDTVSTLIIDITSAGGWNFASAPPAGADCTAPSGTTPVQITCVLAPTFAGTLQLLLLGTGGVESFTASLTAPDNTDPTPEDASVSFGPQ